MSGSSPVKVQMAAMFIDQMRGRVQQAQVMMIVAEDMDENIQSHVLTPPELQAYNAALFVMYGYFSGEMDYEEDPPKPEPPSASGGLFGI